MDLEVALGMKNIRTINSEWSLGGKIVWIRFQLFSETIDQVSIKYQLRNTVLQKSLLANFVFNNKFGVFAVEFEKCSMKFMILMLLILAVFKELNSQELVMAVEVANFTRYLSRMNKLRYICIPHIHKHTINTHTFEFRDALSCLF